jgi:hypothetical protein
MPVHFSRVTGIYFIEFKCLMQMNEREKQVYRIAKSGRPNTSATGLVSIHQILSCALS